MTTMRSYTDNEGCDHYLQVKSAKRKRVENGKTIADIDTFCRDVAAIGEGLVKSLHLSPARRKFL